MYYSNKRLALSFFWTVLGITLLALSVGEVLDNSIYAGMGGALTAVGFLQVIRTMRYRKDPEYREKIDTAVNDERNRFIRMQSWSWTGYIMILAEGVGSIIAMILGRHDIQQMLAYSVCAILCVYWISYLVLSRKY